MGGTALQLTLREMRRLFVNARAIGVIGVVIVVLGLSGPFDTFALLPLGPRFAYWAAIVLLTFAAGAVCGTWILALLEGRQWPQFARIVLAGVAAGLPVAAVVTLVNIVTFDGYRLEAPTMVATAFYSVLIAMAVSFVFWLFHIGQAPDTGAQSGTPKLLNRLGLPQRGTLVSLSMQDHYVEVTTNKAKTLLLMRLSDAIAETDGVRGLQIHRSHWVALDQVSRVTRPGGKLTVETSAGDRLPISRGFQAAARDAGLIAK